MSVSAAPSAILEGRKSGRAVRQHPRPWPTRLERADMEQRTCTIDGCERPLNARGLCRPHLYRLRRYGDPLGGVRMVYRVRPAGVSDAEWLLEHRKVDPASGCWEWQGARNAGGYGVWNAEKTHRMAYRAWVGPLPPDSRSTYVCHRCDNPPCFNPDHLFLGTPQDNMDDMIRKQRSVRGERHSRALITEADVRAIRCDPRPHKEIGEDYGIAWQTVGAIKSRRNWGWLED